MKNFLFCLFFSLLFVSAAQAQADSSQSALYLPLQVTNLDAKVIDKSIQLRWTVAGNEEAKNFEIERADDGKNFRKIGGRLATAQTGEVAYEFVDALPKKNILFSYRVRLNGKDGSTNQSSPQAIKIGSESLQCRLKQNPVRQQLEVEVTAAIAGQLVVTIVTGYGQKISSETMLLSAGANSISLSVQNLQAGLHRLVLEYGSERKLLSFVKE